MNSKNKGKVGEREFSDFCKKQGFDTRRGVQYSGIGGDDVVGLEHIHIEVKRDEHLNINKAMEQSVSEAKGSIPIVAHRKNRTDWLVTMTADDWFKLYKKAICDGMNANAGS